MATYVTYDVVGEKEDISDIISNIDPTDVPFTTSLGGTDTVHATTFQWQEDSIRAPAANAQLEGFTASDITITPTTMRNNVTQIFAEAYKVAGTTDAISSYGRSSESAYQATKTAKALKLDLEYAYVGADQAKVAPSDNLTARKLGGYQDQIAAANRVATGGVSTVPTEANITTVLQAIFEAGGGSKVIQVTPTNSMTVANFATATGRSRDLQSGDDKTIVNVVEVYVSPFGRHKVAINRQLHAKWTLIYSPENWKKVVLQGRNWAREKLAKTGDAETFLMLGEFSLKHMNQAASGGVEMAAS